MEGGRIYLLVLGAVALLFGVVYVVAPDVMLERIGSFPDLGPEATTDVRATYGGLQIALGIVVLWCAGSPDRRATGLLVAAVTMGSLAVSRTIGLLVDREPTIEMTGAAALEAAWCLLAVLLLRRRSSS